MVIENTSFLECIEWIKAKRQVNPLLRYSRLIQSYSSVGWSATLIMWRSAVQLCLGLLKVKNPGGLAQLARALAWHARGHRFDPDILHFNDL